jgi:hypothetical protein
VNLIEDDPSDFPHDFRSAIQHRPKNLHKPLRETVHITMGELTSVVITRHDAVGLMVTSPVISPTSPNSASISRYF